MLWIKLIGFLIVSYLLVVWIFQHLATFLFTKIDLRRYHEENAQKRK